MRLASEPAGPVTVTLNGGDQLRTNPASLLFTAGNWDEPQKVTVRAVNDAIAEGGGHEGTLSHIVTSSDAFYDGMMLDDLSVTVADNDAAGVQVDPTRLQLDPGQQGSYTLRLTSKPNSEVIVYLQPQEELTLDADLCDEEGGTCLRFTPQNWQVVQTVLVTMAGESAAATAIDHTVVSGDPLYANASAPSVHINAPFSGMLFLPIIGR